MSTGFPSGKVVNDALIDVGIQCYDVDSAEKSFDRILHDLDGYKTETAKSIKMFLKIRHFQLLEMNGSNVINRELIK